MGKPFWSSVGLGQICTAFIVLQMNGFSTEAPSFLSDFWLFWSVRSPMVSVQWKLRWHCPSPNCLKLYPAQTPARWAWCTFVAFLKCWTFKRYILCITFCLQKNVSFPFLKKASCINRKVSSRQVHKHLKHIVTTFLAEVIQGTKLVD